MPVENWTNFQLRWGLGQLVSLLALAAVVQLGLTGTPIIIAATLLVVAFTVRPQIIGRLQTPLTRFGPKVILVLILGDFVLSAGDIVPPLIRTLSLLLTYRALEFRHPRQDRQLVLLALLLLLMTGTLTADLVFACLLFLFVPVALFLLAVAVAEESNPYELHDWRDPWRGFSWWRFFRRNRHRLDRRILAFAGGLYAFFGIASMGLFWSLPRFEFGHQLPFFQLPAGKSLTGFSESVTFGAVVDIKKDNSVAMRVDAPSSAAYARPYWRMMVLDEYTGRGFRQSESARESAWIMSDSKLVQPGPRMIAGEDELWTHFMEGGLSRQLPIPGAYREMRFTSRQNLRFNTAVGTVSLKETPANLLVFQMEPVSLSPDIPVTMADAGLRDEQALLLVGPEDSPPNYPHTTHTLPDDPEMLEFLDGAVQAIRDRTGDSGSLDDFAASAIAWLQEGRGYSLSTNLGTSEHPLITWMRSHEAGHCELYAGSLVLLARKAGIPARLITGYHGGVWNGFEDYFMVRNSDAHAWVELFDGAGNWHRYDPTPGNTRVLSGERGDRFAVVPEPRPVDSTWEGYLDSLRVLWYRKVVNFDQADQEAMVEAAQSLFVAWWEVLRENLRRAGQAFVEILRSPFTLASYEGLVPVLLAALVILSGIWIARRVSRILSGRKPASSELVIRRRAALWLGRLSGRTLPEEAAVDDLRGRLLVLRFGDPQSWENPPEVFRAARLLVRSLDRI